MYLIQWEDPDPEQDDASGPYADDYLREALDNLVQKTGHDRVFLAGYSLGGTLAAIFSTLHQERLIVWLNSWSDILHLTPAFA